MDKKTYELSPEEVSVVISEDEFALYSDEGCREPFIGQERAREALKLGLEIRSKGYNIFVIGPAGSGKRTALRQTIHSINTDMERLKDIVFVYNFAEPDCPRVLYFPPGGGGAFKGDIHSLVERMKSIVQGKLEGPDFDRKKEEIVAGFRQKERLLVDAPETENGAELKELYTSLKHAREDMEKQLTETAMEFVLPELDAEFAFLHEAYDDVKTRTHLAEMKQDILNRLYLFISPKDDDGRHRLIRYGVNIIVDASQFATLPVLYEKNPAHHVLNGRVEHNREQEEDQGLGFMNIRAGSLVKASGGILILEAEDVLKDQRSWQNLKRVIQEEAVEIEPVSHPSDMGPLLKPEPVEVDLKIVLIGEEQLYHSLFTKDPELTLHFKILAEFERDMRKTRDSLNGIVRFIHAACSRKKLKPVEGDGLSALLEYCCRLAGHKNRLSSRFLLLEEALVEADYWAGRMDKSGIDREAVKTGLQKRYYRLNMVEERIDEAIAQGEIQVKLEGTAVGRINGLTVIDRGYYLFGKPAVISSRTAPGREGVVNIEREAGLSGGHHDKGVLILEGFIKSRYTRTFPLSVYATLCFEQSYGDLDGDSASTAELLAMLSALADIPLRQDIAVTGSVDSLGDIHPVGCITEKVEGFFRICKRTGLTGTQGVIIPALNTVHLSADSRVADAVREGTFHVYPVRRVDEALELLSGMESGIRDTDGAFREGTVNYIIEQKLRIMADVMKKYKC